MDITEISEVMAASYDKTYDMVFNQLKNSMEKDSNYTLKDLRRFLDSQYTNEGNNWLGRSEVLDNTQAATIAAAEAVYALYRK